MAKEVDIELIRGDDPIIRTTLDSNGDISGWTFEFAIRKNRDEADSVSPLITEDTTGVDVEIFDAGSPTTPGVIDIKLTGVTSSLTIGTRWWGLKRSNAGLKTTIVHGDAVIVNTASR